MLGERSFPVYPLISQVINSEAGCTDLKSVEKSKEHPPTSPNGQSLPNKQLQFP